MKSTRKSPLELEIIEAKSCTVDLRLKIVHDLPFFSGLSHEAIQEINLLFNDSKYEIDETIYSYGDRSTKLYVIASGSVKLIKQSDDGRETLIDILKQGEFFGNLDPFGETHYEETAEAQQPSCIMNISSEDFRKILQKYPDASFKILDITAKRLSEAQEMIKLLSVDTAETRIAYTLHKLAQKLGENKDGGLLIRIPLSRDDIAGITGTTPETASRIISKLKKEGILRTGRKWISIIRPDKLKTILFSN